MRIVQLIYVSTCPDESSYKELVDILRVSKKNNQALGITGLLLYDNNYFLQVLEGERSAVNRLMQNIANDKRHSEVVILSYEEVDVRLTSQWHMGMVHLIDKKREVINRYFSKAEFLPYELSAGGARLIMEELSALVEKEQQD